MIKEVIYFQSNDRWIIGAIAKKCQLALSREVKISFLPTKRLTQLRPSMFYQSKVRKTYKNVLFLGQTSFFNVLEKRPTSEFQNCRVFFTHLIEESALSDLQIYHLNLIEKIFTMNQLSKKILENVGVTTPIEVVYGAVDNSLFYPIKSQKKKPYILISCICAPRKNPEGIIDLIRSNPNFDFIIHGNNWSKYRDLNLENLEIVDFNYDLQPKLMREASVFISYAWFEGGPFPVLEALASGTPVLATRTGFCPDLIQTETGRIIEVGDNISLIINKLKDCFELKDNAQGRNLLPIDLSWSKLAHTIYD